MKDKLNRLAARRTILKAALAIPPFLSVSLGTAYSSAATGVRRVVKNSFIARTIRDVDEERLRKDIFYLAKDPLPMRKLNLSLPGHDQNTLHEADHYLTKQLEQFGYKVMHEEVAVRAFRCDSSKPKAHQYAQPLTEDPYYQAYNLYAERPGRKRPEEIVLLLAHKDSQSWVDSPGAYDNAVGTAAVLELARVFSLLEPERTIRFLLCNEEHTPWTSVVAAQSACRRGDNLVAIFNLDGLGGKSQEDIDAGVKTNVTMYTTDEGRPLAELMKEVNEVYRIGLRQRIGQRQSPGDDDGSFVNAGYRCAVVNIGSHPFADPEYHREGDVPERVDFENVCMAAQATLAAVLELDRPV